MDEAEQTVGAEHPDEHQKDADGAAGDEGRIDGGFQVFVLLRPEEERRDDGAGDVAAEGEGDEDQRDLIAVADGGQRILADEFAGDKAVGNVVELLEEDAAEQGQAELPEHLLGLAGRQILIHGPHPPAGR